MSSDRDSQIPALDGMRGFAVVLVFLFHGVGGTMQPLYEPHRYIWSGLAALILKITEPLSGGVEIFFVLSGYLITRSLLKSINLDGATIRSFYLRRRARIAPLYWLVLLILLLCGYPLLFLALSALFLMNFAPLLSINSDWLPIWSISVEVQFYILWPLLLRLLGPRHLLKLCLLIILISPVLRAVGIAHDLDTYSITFFRLDGLALGSAFALLINGVVRQELRLSKSVRRIFGICLTAFFFIVVFFPDLLDRQTLGGRIFSYEVWQIFALALIGFSLSPTRCFLWLNWRPLRKTGEWSYGILLFHPMLFYAFGLGLKKWHPLSDPRTQLWFVLVQAALIYVLTFILARISYVYFERPVYRLFSGKLRKGSPAS
jgi:peptidoglycan/LPS O-acetylase OafA/YrhL